MGSPLLDTDIVIFGGHGDLSTQKLVPALFTLHTHNMLSEHTQIILVTRRDMSPLEHNAFIKNIITNSQSDSETIESFIGRISHLVMDITTGESYQSLAKIIQSSVNSHTVFYFSIAASLYETTCHHLNEHHLVHVSSNVVLEKPTGNDLFSFKEITRAIYQIFDKDNIFFIDHYLGKDAVSNILQLRFANPIFSNIWHKEYIDHFQITLLEENTVGQRLGYYNQYGATLDMVQNHILQLLCLLTMEQPTALTADAINDERVKVLQRLSTLDAENIQEATVRGVYKSEYSNQLNVETFTAMKLEVANNSMNGVPIYIRTGKCTSAKKSQIIVHFKIQTDELFSGDNTNTLIIDLRPEGKISLRLTTKDRESLIMGQNTHKMLDSEHNESRGVAPNSYERLIFDVIQNNRELFVREDVIEHSWVWMDKITKAWHDTNAPITEYEMGEDGPLEATKLIEKDHRNWY